MKIVFLEEFGKAFIPKKIRPKLSGYLLKAGIQEVPYKFFGALFYLSLAATYLIYLYYVMPWLSRTFGSAAFVIWTFVLWVMIQLGFVALIMMAVYSYLDIVIFNRTKKMEEVLPDFLNYVSENLRGGMSFDKAMWSSIKPEFGVLADEVSLVAKRVMSGNDVEEALLEFTQKYDSPIMRRSFGLIVEGMKGGAPIADLIERIQADLVDTMNLKSEMSGANATYIIFLTAIVLFIAPALFALSFNLLKVFIGIAGNLGSATQAASNLPFQISSVQINPEGFKTFSFLALITIAIFSSMIISIIRKGNIKQGIKYIPVYGAISIIMYYLFMSVFGAVFSGMTNAF